MSYDYPKDTDTHMYLNGDLDLRELIDRCKDKWPRAKFEDIGLLGTRIQVRGCGCHSDYWDYEDFIQASCYVQG